MHGPFLRAPWAPCVDSIAHCPAPFGGGISFNCDGGVVGDQIPTIPLSKVVFPPLKLFSGLPCQCYCGGVALHLMQGLSEACVCSIVEPLE